MLKNDFNQFCLWVNEGVDNIQQRVNKNPDLDVQIEFELLCNWVGSILLTHAWAGAYNVNWLGVCMELEEQLTHENVELPNNLHRIMNTFHISENEITWIKVQESMGLFSSEILTVFEQEWVGA